MVLEFLATVFGAAYWSGRYVTDKLDKVVRETEAGMRRAEYKRDYEPKFATEDDERRVKGLIPNQCFEIVGEDFEAVVGKDYREKYEAYRADPDPCQHKDWLGHRYDKWAMNLMLAREGKIPREFNKYSCYSGNNSYDGNGHRVSTTATKEDIEFCKLLEKHMNENGIPAKLVFQFDSHRVWQGGDKRINRIWDSGTKDIPDYCLAYGNIVLDTEAFEGGYRLW